MFEIGWSELLIIGVVALIVVGPKDLPVMLRVIGRYVGLVKRQADEFRAQFQEAMQQAELEQLRKDVTDIKAGAEETLRDVKRTFDEGLEEKPLATTAPQAGTATETTSDRQDPLDKEFEAWNERVLRSEAAAKANSDENGGSAAEASVVAGKVNGATVPAAAPDVQSQNVAVRSEPPTVKSGA